MSEQMIRCPKCHELHPPYWGCRPDLLLPPVTRMESAHQLYVKARMDGCVSSAPAVWRMSPDVFYELACERPPLPVMQVTDTVTLYGIPVDVVGTLTAGTLGLAHYHGAR